MDGRYRLDVKICCLFNMSIAIKYAGLHHRGACRVHARTLKEVGTFEADWQRFRIVVPANDILSRRWFRWSDSLFRRSHAGTLLLHRAYDGECLHHRNSAKDASKNDRYRKPGCLFAKIIRCASLRRTLMSIRNSGFHILPKLE